MRSNWLKCVESITAANNVVKEPDSVKLSYKRSRNIQLEYEEIQDHTIWIDGYM